MELVLAVELLIENIKNTKIRYKNGRKFGLFLCIKSNLNLKKSHVHANNYLFINKIKNKAKSFGKFN